MPYNTTAIPPRTEATGQTQLPLTRVRKIISVDPDVAICSNNAAFVITLATELFLQYVSAEAQNMVKLDRKPRRNVQYKDLAQAVARIDRLEFLEDIVPPTVSLGKVRAEAAATQKKLRAGNAAAAAGSAAGKAAAHKSDRASTGSTAPTAIASLTNGDSAADAAAPAAAPAPAPASAQSAGKKKQQQLPFSILNHDSNGSNFRPARASSGSDGSGVAAAAALAQAAAASGTSLADEPGPNAQLQQDMLRMQAPAASSSAHARHPSGDVEMLDG